VTGTYSGLVERLRPHVSRYFPHARLRPINLDCKEEHSYELSVRLPERLRCDLILEHCERVPRKLTTRRRGD
jgi:hypothetical protein